MDAVDRAPERARSQPPPRGLCTLLLSDDEFELFDAVVELVTDQCELKGVALDPSGEHVRNLVVSSLVAAYLEQHKAVIERGTLPKKESDDE